jgi:hypothetical protein
MLLRRIESALRNAYNLISRIAWQVQSCPKALDRFRLWLDLDLPTLKILRTQGCISTLLGRALYLHLSWLVRLNTTFFGWSFSSGDVEVLLV